MKTFSAICLALLAGGLSASAQGQEKKIEVIVENPWNAEKVDEPVVIDLSSLGAGIYCQIGYCFRRDKRNSLTARRYER